MIGAATLFISLAAGPATVSAADALTMDATVLLQGHVRSGAWTAIDVSLSNSGAPVSGELRYSGGAAGQVQFATAVDLPPQSRKTYELFVQPPQSFGTASLTISLVSGDRTIATRKLSVTSHDDYSQLVIGVVAEHPEPIVSGMRLLTQPNATAPAIIPLSPKDLPSRAEAWAPLDRLVWQDVDSSELSPGQLAAMEGWIGQGGRLTIVGGTSPASSLSAFPDGLLPYRPTTTVDVPPDAIEGLTGSVPAGLSALPALAATTSTGRVLARNGEAVIAAERSHGSGAVTLVGFDPDAGALAGTPASTGLWQRLQPSRSGAGARALVDENTIVNALSNLPAIGLPPIGGLLLLLVAYIVLIGPINYLVLRRLDRREWAWLTMPALIVLFAAGAYAYGMALRGTNIQVSEVTIVRGGVGATAGAAQAYLGVFSPSRSTYQLNLPDGALVTAPMSGDPSIQTAALHVLQGEPARVRDLDVGFASLRALRADTTAPLPHVAADLRLEGGQLVGTIRNDSSTLLQRTAIAFGSNAQVLGDLKPGESRRIAFTLGSAQWGMPLSQLVLGDAIYGGPMGPTDADRRAMARRFVLDQLTFDPTAGGMGQLQSDTPVLLAWGTDPVVPVEIQGERPQVIADTLYYVPVSIAVHGDVAFGPDLMRSTVIDSATTFFNKDPTTFVFGQGTVTLAFRPVSFGGTIQPKRLAIALNVGPNMAIGPGKTIEPLAPAESPAAQPLDGIPSIELLDRASGKWLTLPHLQGGAPYEVADASRYVDPSSGTVLVRFRNDRQEQVGFQFSMQLDGTVE